MKLAPNMADKCLTVILAVNFSSNFKKLGTFPHTSLILLQKRSTLLFKRERAVFFKECAKLGFVFFTGSLFFKVIFELFLPLNWIRLF